MAPGLFTMMKKYPIRSFLFMGTANTSLYFFYDYTMTKDVMKTSCHRAALVGDQALKNPQIQPRHITVILNPVAGKRKSKKLYNKCVEPLLHLAGIKVSLIETESPNQAYNIMKIMSNCDGVAIVGGDGTVHEALNGLLHRDDRAKAAQDFPIAIMPTGQYNSIARYIHQNLSYRNQKEFLIQSTLRLIDSCTQKFDVLKVTPLDEELKEGKQPTYVLRDVRYGRYQDNFFKVSGFSFYQNNIKPYWLRLQRFFNGSKYPKPLIDSISYTEPCLGCSRCYEKHRLVNSNAAVEEQSVNRRWWSMLAPVSKSGPSPEALKELELSKRDNPNCDKWIKIQDTGDLTDFRACMMEDRKVRLSLGSSGEYTPSEVIETQDVRLKLATDVDNEMKASHSKTQAVNLQLSDTSDQQSGEVEKVKEDKTVKYLIDGQPTQAHSIEITAINKAITVYTGIMKIIPPTFSKTQV